MDESKLSELDRIAISYDPSDPSQFFDYWFKRFEAEAVTPWMRGDSVLELGGATGESAMLLRSLTSRYTIVEGSPINCEVIRGRLPDVSVIEAFWEDFEPDERFSDIVLFETLEHYSEPVALLTRCRGWLQAGGRIHISVPNGESLHRKVAVHMGLQPSATYLNESDRNQGHLRNYSLEALISHVERSSLKIVHQQGLFLKLVPNRLMLGWDESLLRGINALAHSRISEAAELFVVCEAG